MIRFKGVTKTYDNVLAIANISFHVSRGGIFGILGPSGAGKTTLIQLMAGLFPPDKGIVCFQDAPCFRNPKLRKMIGVMPQQQSLYGDLTGEENLFFFAKMHTLSETGLTKKIVSALSKVGLQTQAKNRVDTFTNGMKKRLNLAIALVHDPIILLLDQPVDSVDTASKNIIFECIRKLRKSSRTIVCATNQTWVAQRLCDRVAVLHRGRLLAEDTVENLVDFYGGKSRIIVEKWGETLFIDTDDPFTELMKYRDKSDWQRFHVESPDLDSVFYNLAGGYLQDF